MGFGVGSRNGVDVFGVLPTPHHKGLSSFQPVPTTEQTQHLAACEEKCLEMQILRALRL